MNNHNPHNNEQRQDERPFTYIRKRALLPQEDRNIDTAQHRSAIPEYQITIEHGSIRIGQECVALALPARWLPGDEVVIKLWPGYSHQGRFGRYQGDPYQTQPLTMDNDVTTIEFDVVNTHPNTLTSVSIMPRAEGIELSPVEYFIFSENEND